MRDMAHSICLIKLYQITMRKNFRFFVSDHLKDVRDRSAIMVCEVKVKFGAKILPVYSPVQYILM